MKEYKTFLEAAHFVLRNTHRPLKAREIIKKVLSEKLWKRAGRSDTKYEYNSLYGTLIKAVKSSDPRFGRRGASDTFFAVDGGNIEIDSTLETELITHEIIDPEFTPEPEGEQVRLHVQYERSRKNRLAAIQFHGTKCKACSFNFNQRYTRLHAQDFIEIHHVRSVAQQKGRPVDPKTDLVPLCSNCHSMVHRQHGTILSVDKLQGLLRVKKGAIRINL